MPKAKGSTIRLINRLIDSMNLPKDIDILLHFINEAIVHKNPKLFLNNFIRFEVLGYDRVKVQFKHRSKKAKR